MNCRVASRTCIGRTRLRHIVKYKPSSFGLYLSSISPLFTLQTGHLGHPPGIILLDSAHSHGSAVTGIGATPSMSGLPTRNFTSVPSFSAPSTEESGQGSAFQTSIPQLEVSLQGTNDIGSPSEVSERSFPPSTGSKFLT